MKKAIFNEKNIIFIFVQVKYRFIVQFLWHLMNTYIHLYSLFAYLNIGGHNLTTD